MISVVVPTYETRELTLRCLDAVVATAPHATEIVLVDDAGSDGTAPAVRDLHPGVRVLVRAERGGFTPAANDGLAAARGGLLLLLNSDTEVQPGAIARLAEVFDREPRVGVAAPALVSPDGSAQWSGGPEPGLAWLFALASGLGALTSFARPRPADDTPAWLTGAALMLRREAWQQAGPLDGDLGFYAQDADLCLRMRDLGWHLRRVPQARVVHVGGASIGRDPGAVAGQQPALLWASLVRLVRKRRGPAAARRAARVLAAGATVRLATRAVAGTTRRSSQWNAETDAYRAARSAIADA